MSSQNVFACKGVPGHPHCVTSGNVKFHRSPIVQGCSGNPARAGNPLRIFYFPIQHTIISKEADIRSDCFGKIINKNEKKDQPYDRLIGSGLDLKLDHPTTLFESAQIAMS